MLPWFAERVLEVDEAALVLWRQLVDAAKAENDSYTPPDGILAATALSRDLGVGTRNAADFRRAGVALVDPWTAPA